MGQPPVESDPEAQYLLLPPRYRVIIALKLGAFQINVYFLCNLRL